MGLYCGNHCPLIGGEAKSQGWVALGGCMEEIDWSLRQSPGESLKFSLPHSAKIYLFEEKRQKEQRDREREFQVGSSSSAEPDAELDLMTLRS